MFKKLVDRVERFVEENCAVKNARHTAIFYIADLGLATVLTVVLVVGLVLGW